MVVITLSTIGYGDILGLTDLYGAQALTMFLATVGYVIPPFLVANIVIAFVDGVLTDKFRRRRMNAKMVPSTIMATAEMME